MVLLFLLHACLRLNWPEGDSPARFFFCKLSRSSAPNLNTPHDFATWLGVQRLPARPPAPQGEGASTASADSTLFCYCSLNLQFLPLPLFVLISIVSRAAVGLAKGSCPPASLGDRLRRTCPASARFHTNMLLCSCRSAPAPATPHSQ